ncbi:MAG: alginate lyase family protein [Anaerolineales bacterium]|nr:alginate lyase family protein [Anaerolineales bacterium]
MNSRLALSYKTFRQLGFRQVSLFAWYQVKLRSGLLRLQTRARETALDQDLQLAVGFLPVPDQAKLRAVLGDDEAALIQEADEILAGQVRLFGGEPRPMKLVLDEPLDHWTRYKSGQYQGEDIKFTWEVGRFGWATALARAYVLSGDEKYTRTFWENTETFLAANPPNRGPHWASAQEVALRLVCLSFAYAVLINSPETTPERTKLLVNSLAAHAARIPPTLVYARAQNNNHLLTEAVGLYTAGTVLPDHPQAEKWRALGWRWLNEALQTQITSVGAYVQNSANYHRLMLQAALWAGVVAAGRGDAFPTETQTKLAAATRWLLALLDEDNGHVPNLGPNDGAYILPLTTQAFSDYRPVLQAAAQTFLGGRPFPPGAWDEMTLWLNFQSPARATTLKETNTPIRISGTQSWAYLRAAEFQARPGHADQLHLDLWWRGLNIACDAGTYLYNGNPPWDNTLAGTGVHNTLTVNGQDQMTRAGRFLWLDWAQAEVMDTGYAESGQLSWVVAQHDGYRKLGVLHRRMVTCEGDQWLVRDQILAEADEVTDAFKVRLRWLLPDWLWELEHNVLRLKTQHGPMTVEVTAKGATNLCFQLVRAGELLAGEGQVDPVQGWYSPTYAQKQPALSLAVSGEGPLPLTLTSQFVFPE